VVSDLLFRLRALLTRKSMEAELDKELRAYLEQQVEKYIKSGLPVKEAERRARLEFGGLDDLKEECRGARGVNFVENLSQDLRYGARILRKKAAFTALTVVTLALGIGANTAIFSIVDAVLVRRLAYRDPDHLVVVWGAQIGQVGSSKLFDRYLDFEAWQHSSRSFDQLEALTWAFAGQTLSWRGKPQRVLAIPATQGIFSLLGVQAAHLEWTI
jgi:putative ABC transport system permease protein